VGRVIIAAVMPSGPSASRDGNRESSNRESSQLKRGFYTIMAAQFFSSLADNALLIAGIAMLIEMHAPEWMKPLLKLFFTISYVVLAPFVGTLADALPKARVMFVTNAIKVFGCFLMFFTVHPVLSYAVVGLGAAAYSPAKYGILTELLPPERLVAANGWIEGTTVGSIILGTVLGGLLISPKVSAVLLAHLGPLTMLNVTTSADAAIVLIAFIYVLAALFNLNIPDTGVRYAAQEFHPIVQIRAFRNCWLALWRDRLGQITLAVTTLFWGAGATLQFIVLDWARFSLGMPLNRAAILQSVVALGIAGGAMLAARYVALISSLRVLPVGVAMGLMVPMMTLVSTEAAAYPMLVMIGALAGFFVVPMNALLQHRGYVLLSAGHSIAVQNFNENLNILLMLGLYSLLLHLELPVDAVIFLFGGFVALTMLMVIARHRRNQREYDSERLIGQSRH